MDFLMSLDPLVRQAEADAVHYRDEAGLLRCPGERRAVIQAVTGPLVEVRCPHYLDALRYEVSE